MNTPLLFVLIAVVLLLSFAWFAARRRKDLAEIDGDAQALASLDIEAFRNLVDPEEEAFLRARLSVAQFKKIKRERAWAALAYVKRLSRASLHFARLGDAARRSHDPAIAASGKEIANSAIRLRLRVLDAGARLILAGAFPAWNSRPLSSLLEQYDHANYLLLNHRSHSRVIYITPR